MANIKSAKKRILVSAKRQLRNKQVRSYTKTTIKKLIAAVDTGDAKNIAETHKMAVRAIDKATTKGVYHKNFASRRKSKLAKLVNRNSQ
ncbi:MAG: 30S ribosomal protein S20 [Turicibacter sp.]|nr:30S ribosomal protein S20 [Turicibacter sp.]